MAEAVAASAARPLACPAAAPRRQVRPAARRPQRTQGLRCRSSQDAQQSAAGASTSTSSLDSTSTSSLDSSSSSVSSSTPMDVLRNDFSYLEDRTGLDLLTPLEAVAEAHDEVVAVLNPIAGEAMQRQLEEQVAGMQQELAVAHTQIHRSEARLRESVDSLSALEGSARQAFAGAAPTSSSSSRSAVAAAAAPAVEQPPQRRLQQPAEGAAAAQPQQLEQQRQRRGPGAGNTSRAASRGRAGLASDLAIPQQLMDYWFPAEFSASLAQGKMVPFELFGQTWVLFRDEAGAAACVRDECAHRACPLSLGSVVEGRVQCPYHGWEYDSAGACTKMPSTAFSKGITVDALPVVESDGLVWIWPGRPEAMTGGPPKVARPPPGFQVHAELVLDVPVEHGLLLENLLDLAHAPFTHTTTFAKGWPVPDVVRFNAAQLLGGSWEPYPIDMQFGPPCMVLSTIGLASPGKIESGARASSCKNHLHQLHVCLPSSEGRTRLLYRMSLDFMHWTKHVPAIGAFWRNIAEQVLGEDLVLVQGQQRNMARGADVWANPVPYDKLGVRYRRWRNSVASGDPATRAAAEAGLCQMSAGEVFSPEDSHHPSEAA